MPYKDPEKQKAAQRESAKRRRETINVWVRNERAKRRQYIWDQKTNPCLDCEQIYDPCIMDLHHRDDTTKLKSLSNMVSERYSYSDIDAEIAKCDLLCANCHRMRHKLLRDEEYVRLSVTL